MSYTSADGSETSTYRTFLRELPRTGPGTLGGRFLRHYWHPVCLSKDLKDLPYPVRMLGEDLVAFRAGDGGIGLLGAYCPHRRAALEYGQIREHALQCSYHGWTFDSQGRCMAMPLEPADSKAKESVRHLWYPAQEWGGVVWCYMGEHKESPPPLPKIDILARDDGELILERGILLPNTQAMPSLGIPNDIRNYNYLTYLENFVDMGHIYALHMLAPPALPEELKPYCDLSVDTDWQKTTHRAIETDYGMKCVVMHNTADADKKFAITFSIALPFYYRFSGLGARLADFCDDRRESGGMIRIIDDEHIELFRYTLIRKGNYRGNAVNNSRASGDDTQPARGLKGTRPKKAYDNRKYGAFEGNLILEDWVMMETPGAIPKREEEHLVSSDVGVALLRRIWRQSMENVAQGRPPKEVATDNNGVVEVDTFKGFLAADQLVIGPSNLPSSREGRGLIRNSAGHLVFG